MKYDKLLINSINIHYGGGGVLLASILRVLKLKSIVYVDERMQLPGNLSNEVHVKCVKPKIFYRLLSELSMLADSRYGDLLLCFGSLPPLFKSRAHTIVFIQNRYLLDSADISEFQISVQLRILVERLWLKLTLKNADEFIVQTKSMRRLLLPKIHNAKPVRVLPFMDHALFGDEECVDLKIKNSRKYDFIYVASGEPHKNHEVLLKAWSILADEGIYPSLCLTINNLDFPVLCESINQLIKNRNIKIFNLGSLPHTKVLALYMSSRAKIYPSKLESFGLPLIEAKNAGLPIIASEMDYVRDILNPEQTFDPNSPVSVARAVKRHLGILESNFSIMNAQEFLTAI